MSKAASKVQGGEKKFPFPHSLIIIFLLICVAAVMTWVIPAGEYVRVEDPATGRMIVDPSSYHRIESSPANPFDVFTAIPRGLSEAGWIAWMVLIIGGSFHVIESTRATRALIGKFMNQLRGKHGVYLLPVLMLPFFMLPAITGNGESMLAFLPLGILIARSLGFDAMTGLCIVTIASSTGYCTGLFSAFSTGTAQSLCGLPTFSGLWFRVVGAVLLFAAAAFWTVKYARMVQKDPKKSYCYELEQQVGSEGDAELVELTLRRKLCLLEFLFGICTIVYAALAGWDFKTRFPAIFIIMAMVIGLTAGFSPNKIAEEFVNGAKMVLVGALVTGFSKGISVILADAHIIDTIVYALSSLVAGLPKQIGAMAMLLVQSILNCFIISSSGQAAATVPIMSPLGDVLGLTQQTVVMAFLYGDGFSNILLPMNASIMGACAISGITYPQYLRRAWRHYVSYMLIGFIMLFVAATINLGPF